MTTLCSGVTMLKSSFFRNDTKVSNNPFLISSCGHHCSKKSTILMIKNSSSNGFQMKSQRVGEHLSSNHEMALNERVLPTVEEVPVMDYSRAAGIGILKFFGGKNFFITGSTGFLAKVLVEKILRTMPRVGKIFLLIKAKNKESAMKRLKNEVIENELFKCLKQAHGESYQSFMLSKLIPIVGNVSEPELGMDDESIKRVANEVDIIVNSAANTTLDQRYDVDLEINTRAPSQLMKFAKKCNNLKLFLHYSTAFANVDREGMIFENPFFMGERLTLENPSALFPHLDIDAEMDLAMRFREAFQDCDVNTRMKEIGLMRARLFGWVNSYTFTKAMGEMVINNMRGEIPLIILRPSIVESTYVEPFPGWIQSNRSIDPLIINYGKGQLPGCFGNPHVPIDIVPVDMVVNASIAAMAKHGMEERPEMKVYHVTSAAVNPMQLQEFFEFCREHFHSYPFVESNGKRVEVTKMKFFSSLDDLSASMWKQIAQPNGLTPSDTNAMGKLQMKYKRRIEHVLYSAKMYQPYTFFKGCFDNGNTQKLMEQMSQEEREAFGIDFGSIDWRSYMLNTHIPGVRKHVMKGRGICG